MPIFEYKCENCGKKFEVLHKSSTNLEEVKCPDCQSVNYKKLLSSFSASVKYVSPSCGDRGCGMPSFGGGCANGMCGLN